MYSDSSYSCTFLEAAYFGVNIVKHQQLLLQLLKNVQTQKETWDKAGIHLPQVSKHLLATLYVTRLEKTFVFIFWLLESGGCA